jgi:hypothetical protein
LNSRALHSRKKAERFSNNVCVAVAAINPGTDQVEVKCDIAPNGPTIYRSIIKDRIVCEKARKKCGEQNGENETRKRVMEGRTFDEETEE